MAALRSEVRAVEARAAAEMEERARMAREVDAAIADADAARQEAAQTVRESGERCCR